MSDIMIILERFKSSLIQTLFHRKAACKQQQIPKTWIISQGM